MRNPLYAVLLTASITSSASHAATITVSANASIQSLQAAIQIANAGDTIVLKGGVFHETALIPSSLSDLTIRGSNGAVLDGRVVTGQSLGACLLIEADRVTIRDLTIRNAATLPGDEGDAIRTTGLETVVDRCTFIGNQRGGVRFSGNAGAVRRSTFVGNDNGVIVDFALGIRIEKCKFDSSATAGVKLSGAHDCVIEKCTFAGSASGGGIDGENGFTNDDLVVRGCTFRKLVGPAILNSGVGATIEKCKFTDNAGHGIAIFEAADVSITSCSFSNLLYLSSAIVLTTVTNATVEKCTIADVSSQGMFVTDATAVAVRSCSFKRGGRDVVPCVIATGSTDVSLEKVTIADWGEGVWSVSGAVLALTSCSVSNCVRDGIDVENTSGAVTLTKCKVKGCLAEGIDNGGPTTDAVDCTFTGNRIDVANDGTLTLTGGTFGTGGTSTLPAID